MPSASCCCCFDGLSFFCSSYRTHIIIEYSRPAVCVYKVDDDEDGTTEMRGRKYVLISRLLQNRRKKKVHDMYMALKMGSIVFRSSTIRSLSLNNAYIQFSSLFLVLSFLFAFKFRAHIWKFHSPYNALHFFPSFRLFLFIFLYTQCSPV